jgi:enoyl-CoA hydratase/carnithine racemase
MAVRTERVGRVVVVTLDRPESRNAINRELSVELRAAFEEFRADRDQWVAVLAGSGKDFCAGADLRESAAAKKRGGRIGGVVTGGILREFECWKPIVGALHGNVLGGGLELALCCDLRVADTSTVFGQLEVTLGLIPGGGGTQRLPRTIPLPLALEIIMTGQKIDAERAERMGLVNYVVPEGKALERALELATLIAERSAPIAVRRAKEAVYRGLAMSLEEGLRLEELLARTLARTADLQEGSRAFLERRPPRYEGA